MDIPQYMEQAQRLLMGAFPNRLVCLGIQGSYARGEAAEGSDIDLVVILDQVEMADILGYRSVLDRLPEREKSCGFFSGKEELMAWDRGELFQFYYDTRPYWGNLEFLRPLLNRRAVARALHTGACGIYHGCIHNLLHAQSMEVLRELYKPVLFLLQAKCWLDEEIYCSDSHTLLAHLKGMDRAVLERRADIRSGGAITGEMLFPLSSHLLDWAVQILAGYAEKSAPAQK